MSARHHSRLSTAGLLRRQFLAGPGASIMLALLVLVGALLATAVPRAVAAMHTAALGVALGDLPANELDLTSALRATPEIAASNGATTLPDDVEAVWGHQEQRLLDIRAGMPQPLRGITEAPLSVLTTGPAQVFVPGAAPSGPVFRVLPGFDPRLREHVTLTSGEWPAPVDEAVPGAAAVEVVFTDAIAEGMQWELGEERRLPAGSGDQQVRLVGTVSAVDPDDGFWTHLPLALEPSILGIDPPVITGVAFVDPASWPAFVDVRMPATMHAWFPAVGDRIEADETRTLIGQLDEFTSQVQSLGDGPQQFSDLTVGEVSFSSGLRDALIEAAAAASASDAVLATIASGPIGVMVAVLVLGARVVFERRRTGLELAAARGASPGQLRGILAIEGLAIGVPAALVGGIAGTVAIAADAGWAGWVIAAVFALTPVVLLVSRAPSLSPLRRARADLGTADRDRWRWIVEALVVVLATVALVLLLRRGLATSAVDTGVDPLLAAVPLLLSLVACVVVLRLYPVPLAGFVRRASRRPSLVPFLGSARSLRDPSAGLVPVLAVVVGVSVAVFSAVLLGTVQSGVERTADAEVGADASVSGTPFTLEQQAAFADVPGVAATAPVYATTAIRVSIDGRNRSTTLIVVDVAEMRAVQAGRVDATPLPEVLAESGDDGVPVVLSRVIASSIEGADEVEIDGEAFEAIGVVDGSTAYLDRASWVLMDRANAEPFTDTLVPRVVLVRFEPGADVARVTAELAEIAGPDAHVTTPDDLRTELHARPTTRGLVVALIAAIVLASLLTALAIVLTLVVGRPARERLLPLLTTLGLPRRGERALVAWEIGPVAVVALVAGAVLGVLLPLVVLQGVDLRAFTSGDHQPVVTYEPWLIAAVLAGSVLVTVVAAAAASRVDGRVNVARAMRKEEE
ncbi:ABC transporter permease [Agromyces ramosus]|uniref:ABC transport system permease protein n=1 Tax=Agromyces ramosus TaxID=33879 RepID=A0ABU0R4Z3_9MICO|nr:ABC transporter permease [Agromyces ramosus]MDQ0893151.1 putative ABC transport system permease protein [Agromyces ramosus]